MDKYQFAIVIASCLSAVLIYYYLSKKSIIDRETCISLVYDHRQGVLDTTKSMISHLMDDNKDQNNPKLGEMLKELNSISGMLTRCEQMINFYDTYKKVLSHVSNIIEIDKNGRQEIKSTLKDASYYANRLDSMKRLLIIDSTIPYECKI
jgi:hypothetical protein